MITSGKWEVVIGGIPATRAIAANDVIIANLNGPPANKEVIDNAQLIAAAPETAKERDRLKIINTELLEACENIRNYEEAGRVIIGDKTAPKSYICNLAEQAIAKATETN